MADKATSHVKLNDYMARNWKLDAGPVAVLNPDSSMHERIAFCWGLTKNLEAIADLGENSRDSDVSRFASLISSMLAPLLATLDNVGDESHQASKGGAA